MLIASLFVFAATALAEGKPKYNRVDLDDDGIVTVQEAREAGIPISEAKVGDLNDNAKLTKKDWQYIDMESSIDFPPDTAYRLG